MLLHVTGRMHTKQTNKVQFDLVLPECECVVPVTNGTPTQEHDEVRDGDDDDDDVLMMLMMMTLMLKRLTKWLLTHPQGFMAFFGLTCFSGG